MFSARIIGTMYVCTYVCRNSGGRLPPDKEYVFRFLGLGTSSPNRSRLCGTRAIVVGYGYHDIR